MKSVAKKIAEGSDEVAVNDDGTCPEGYVLNADKSACCVDKEEKTESHGSVVPFKIGHKDPQFVVDGALKIKVESGKFVQFEDNEAIEVVENKSGNIQIGSSDNVIEISDHKLATKFFESINHKDDVKIEDREVTVAEAIKSSMDVTKVANMILEQHKGSLDQLKEGNSIVRIKVARKIRALRSTAMKAASVRPVESKSVSFTLHKALDIIK